MTAEHVVIGRGRLMADMAMSDLIAYTSSTVRTPGADMLADAVAGPDVSIAWTAPEVLEVTG